MKDTDRTRNWTFLLYPDSAPEDWLDIIQSWHIEFVVSPLHNKDVNPDGTLKKEHYHVMIMYGGLKSYQQVIKQLEPLNCTIPIIVHNVKSLVRYMAHLDNPDKYKYDITDVKCYGGIDIADLLKVTSSERYGYIKEMVEFCRDRGIIEITDLIDYAAAHNKEWFQTICDSSLFIMQSYIQSQRHRTVKTTNIDLSTGELLR